MEKPLSGWGLRVYVKYGENGSSDKKLRVIKYFQKTFQKKKKKNLKSHCHGKSHVFVEKPHSGWGFNRCQKQAAKHEHNLSESDWPQSSWHVIMFNWETFDDIWMVALGHVTFHDISALPEGCVLLIRHSPFIRHALYLVTFHDKHVI